MTIASALVGFRADKALTPGMHGIVLRVAAELDRRRVRWNQNDALWVELPTADLRVGGRSDNHWLRQWLAALTGVRLGGEREGVEWGAVLVAEWHIERGGRSVRVLVPPAAVNVIRAPGNFAKVETECLFRLRGAARELYLALADKKRMRQKFWEFELPELRAILGVGERKAYERWDNLLARVLKPALAAINDLGTVNVSMTTIRAGRVVSGVRFEWEWKSLDELRESAEEVDRHSEARRKPVEVEPVAPPLVPPVESRRGSELSADERRKRSERSRPLVAAALDDLARRERGEVTGEE